MSNISDLKDALVVKAADITDELDRLDCLAAIDDWYSCRTAVASLQSGADVASYTMGGRTITLRTLADAQVTERQLWARVQELLYCRGAVGIDMSEPT